MGLRSCETCDECVAVNLDLLKYAENGFYSKTSYFVGSLVWGLFNYCQKYWINTLLTYGTEISAPQAMRWIEYLTKAAWFLLSLKVLPYSQRRDSSR